MLALFLVLAGATALVALGAARAPSATAQGGSGPSANAAQRSAGPASDSTTPTAASISVPGSGGAPGPGTANQAPAVARGRTLFVESCASCHGFDADGRPGLAPTLVGVGGQSADFYLSTGRMPLASPDDEPLRAEPRFDPNQIADLVAYVSSLGGPPVPETPPPGDLAKGTAAFAESCAGCHQAIAQGGIVTGAYAPALSSATPRQVLEAVRVGPYLMPRFGERTIDDQTLASIATYVEYTKHPDNSGGWAIGNLGPVPEGMVAWLIAIVVLLLTARVIGDRAGENKPEEKEGS